MESAAWSFALFKAFILDLKALPSPTISHNSIGERLSPKADPSTVFKPQALRNNSFPNVPGNDSSSCHSSDNSSLTIKPLTCVRRPGFQASLRSYRIPHPLILQNGAGDYCIRPLRACRRIQQDKGCDRELNCHATKPHAITTRH